MMPPGRHVCAARFQLLVVQAKAVWVYVSGVQSGGFMSLTLYYQEGYHT